MGLFILRRFGVMLLTALCLTFVVFFLTNLYPNLEKLAKTQGNQRMSDEQVEAWLENRGYLQPTLVKYGQWLGVMPGFQNTPKMASSWEPAQDPVRRQRTRQDIVVFFRAIGDTQPFSRKKSEPSLASAWAIQVT